MNRCHFVLFMVLLALPVSARAQHRGAAGNTQQQEQLLWQQQQHMMQQQQRMMQQEEQRMMMQQQNMMRQAQTATAPAAVCTAATADKRPARRTDSRGGPSG